MTTLNYTILTLVGLVIIFYLLWRRSAKLLKETKFAKASLSTKYGKLSEQFMPFLKDYPFDPHRFRFLGTPIDGVQFEEDHIVFVEFKTNQSQLTTNQKKIIDNINNKRVFFKELRID